MVSRRTGRRPKLICALVAALIALAASPRARAGELTRDERVHLAAGELVHRRLDVELPKGGYFGGIAYIIIDAPAARVMRALDDTSAYRAIFPLTLEAKAQGRRGYDRLVFFRHGGRVGSAGYTAIVRRESPSLVRFWLDPSRPHEVEDMWGYFRVDPLGPDKSLLTYGALLLLEPGFVRFFFSEKIRSYALETPLLVKRWVEGRGR